jgi:putative transposase
MARRLPKQLMLPEPRTWGGRRDGAGRRSSRVRPDVPHVARPTHDARHPVHITLRAARGLESLRSTTAFSALVRAFSAASRDAFRILHFSVQTDHIHLIVEADSDDELRSGLNGLTCRAARALNRAWRHRGPIWGDRYHARALATPREVRNGLVYVLLNFRKHLRAPPTVDPRSSGRWFDGWSEEPPYCTQPCPVAKPRTWLGAVGWRRAGGPIAVHEMPVRL